MKAFRWVCTFVALIFISLMSSEVDPNFLMRCGPFGYSPLWVPRKSLTGFSLWPFFGFAGNCSTCCAHEPLWILWVTFTSFPAVVCHFYSPIGIFLMTRGFPLLS